MKYLYTQHSSRLSTLAVTFGAGSRVEFQTKFPAGIAHFMEHFRFKGTSKYSAKDLIKKAAFYGGSWNAFTSEDLVTYYIKIPDESLEHAFDFLSEIILHPTFPNEELGREKEVVEQEIRMYDDDIGDLVHRELQRKVFNNSLSKPIIGTSESVKSITRSDLVEFNKAFCDKKNMLVTLASRNDSVGADLLHRYFGQTDDSLVYSPPDINPKYSDSFNSVVHKDGLIQDTIVVSFGKSGIYNKNQRAVCKVFNSIFGADSDSRLFLRIRDDLGLVYGIGSHMSANMDGSLFTIATQTDPHNTETVLSEIDKEIEMFVNSSPTEEELQRAKNCIRSNQYAALDSSYGLVMNAISKEFYGTDSPMEFLKDVDAVSLDDVRSFARSVFDSNKYTVIGKNNK